MTEIAFVTVGMFTGTVETSVFIAAAIVAGAASGALASWLYLRRTQRPEANVQPLPPLDPKLNEEIQRAADAWAKDHGRPEATDLVADKLRLVHGIGARRGWWQ